MLASLTPSPAFATLGMPVTSPAGHKIYGLVQSFTPTMLVLRTRTGRLLAVDRHAARSAVELRLGRPVIVFGPSDARGVVRATAIWRTFPNEAFWPADR
jgi:hypothetical protein